MGFNGLISISFPLFFAVAAVVVVVVLLNSSLSAGSGVSRLLWIFFLDPPDITSGKNEYKRNDFLRKPYSALSRVSFP